MSVCFLLTPASLETELTWIVNSEGRMGRERVRIPHWQKKGKKGDRIWPPCVGAAVLEAFLPFVALRFGLLSVPFHVTLSLFGLQMGSWPETLTMTPDKAEEGELDQSDIPLFPPRYMSRGTQSICSICDGKSYVAGHDHFTCFQIKYFWLGFLWWLTYFLFGFTVPLLALLFVYHTNYCHWWPHSWIWRNVVALTDWIDGIILPDKRLRVPKRAWDLITNVIYLSICTPTLSDSFLINVGSSSKRKKRGQNIRKGRKLQPSCLCSPSHYPDKS